MTPEFRAWPKIPRLNRTVTITEKIDGTNACVVVHEGAIWAQSRKRFITRGDDNFGFAAWVMDNYDELLTLGEGYHYGEWYGRGIQRGYGLEERRFALFNTFRWTEAEASPACCDVVPVLYVGECQRLNAAVAGILDDLEVMGSRAVPGFMQPEGVVVYHHAAKQNFKVLLEGDDVPKGQAA